MIGVLGVHEGVGRCLRLWGLARRGEAHVTLLVLLRLLLLLLLVGKVEPARHVGEGMKSSLLERSSAEKHAPRLLYLPLYPLLDDSQLSAQERLRIPEGAD